MYIHKMNISRKANKPNLHLSKMQKLNVNSALPKLFQNSKSKDNDQKVRKN